MTGWQSSDLTTKTGCCDTSLVTLAPFASDQAHEVSHYCGPSKGQGFLQRSQNCVKPIDQAVNWCQCQDSTGDGSMTESWRERHRELGVLDQIKKNHRMSGSIDFWSKRQSFETSQGSSFQDYCRSRAVCIQSLARLMETKGRSA